MLLVFCILYVFCFKMKVVLFIFAGSHRASSWLSSSTFCFSAFANSVEGIWIGLLLSKKLYSLRGKQCRNMELESQPITTFGLGSWTSSDRLVTRLRDFVLVLNEDCCQLTTFTTLRHFHFRALFFNLVYCTNHTAFS